MKRLLFQACVLIALSVAAGALTFYLHPRAPALYLYQETVSEDEVNMLMVRALEKEQGVLWIDARSRSEFEKEHVPGTHLLNEQEFDALIFELLDVLSSNTKTIVIYCDAQKCDQSRFIAEKLRDLGNQEIKVLKGGWIAWKNAPPP